MTIVMGLDQHRAPADRNGLRRFAAGFRGQELEVALEATTGWRFAVEEFQAIGAKVHLAEPARRRRAAGPRSEPRAIRVDARHVRELLMVGRLPESRIPRRTCSSCAPAWRLRHTLVDQRREWQQRLQAVLYGISRARMRAPHGRWRDHRIHPRHLAMRKPRHLPADATPTATATSSVAAGRKLDTSQNCVICRCGDRQRCCFLRSAQERLRAGLRCITLPYVRARPSCWRRLLAPV